MSLFSIILFSNDIIALVTRVITAQIAKPLKIVGLTGFWWEFDSLIPCSQKVLESLVFTGFRALSFFVTPKRV